MAESGPSTPRGFSTFGFHLETNLLVLQVRASVPLAEKWKPSDRLDSSSSSKNALRSEAVHCVDIGMISWCQR